MDIDYPQLDEWPRWLDEAEVWLELCHGNYGIGVELTPSNQIPLCGKYPGDDSS